MALRGTGTGVRRPTRPVANWSRLVLPIRIAPAACNRATAGAVSVGGVGEVRAGRGGRQAGHVDVVLDGEGHAPERPRHGVEGLERGRLRQRLGLRHQGQEDAGVVNRGEPAVGLATTVRGSRPSA